MRSGIFAFGLLFPSSTLAEVTIRFEPSSVCPEGKKNADCLAEAKKGTVAFNAFLQDSDEKFSYDKDCGYSFDYRHATEKTTKTDFNIASVVLAEPADKCAPVAHVTKEHDKCSADDTKLDSKFKDGKLTADMPVPLEDDKFYVNAGADGACFAKADEGVMRYEYVYTFEPADPSAKPDDASTKPDDASSTSPDHSTDHTTDPATDGTTETSGANTNLVLFPLAATFALTTLLN